MRGLIAIFFSTFVTEDLTAIATGVLVEQGHVHPVAGVVACAAGIYVGDLGLFGIGRFAGARLPHRCRTRLATVAWGPRGAALAILGSRFVPGTRLPLYLAAGSGAIPFATFALWSFIAVALWTPALVLITAAFSTTASPLARAFEVAWAPGVAAAAIVLLGRSAAAAWARSFLGRGSRETCA